MTPEAGIEQSRMNDVSYDFSGTAKLLTRTCMERRLVRFYVIHTLDNIDFALHDCLVGPESSVIWSKHTPLGQLDSSVSQTA